MKRSFFILSFLLVMVISLSACQKSNQYSDLLTAEPWKDIMTDGAATISLYKDGTGNFSAERAGVIGFNYAITWELNESSVLIKSPAAQFSLYITETDGVITLKNESGQSYYVPSSQYDEIRKNTKLPTDTISIEIINNNGEKESLTANELCKLRNDNGARFEKLYFGAPITVIGVIKAVHGSTISNGHKMSAYVELNDGWEVEAVSVNDVVDLNPNDIVKITGCIYDAFAGKVSIFIVNGNTTTIELYSE